MKTIQLAFRISTLLFVVATQARAAEGDLRLILGDELQERRTTAVNWPGLRTRAVPKPSAAVEPPPAVTPVVVAAKPFRVMVDAGHGGHDYGAPGTFGAAEKEICLRIAANVKSRLERAANLADFPMEVQLSRSTDHFIALRDRVRQANDWGADLFVSVHANSSPVPRARGFEVYFLSNEATDAEASRVARQENAEAASAPLSPGILSILSDLKTNSHILESSRFAENVYGSLASLLRPNGKGVRQAPFTVLSGTQMPALLIEVGYLTNAEEALALGRSSYQHRIASGISDGVLSFALRMRRLSSNPVLRLGKRAT
jgi:N-acetylmuramoyl-L-alanine amidase